MKRILLMLVVVGLIGTGAYFAWSRREISQVRQMQIGSVNLAAVRDGAYRGSYSYGSFTYVVETVVKDHQVVDIRIISNRTTDQARQAEGVLPLVLKAQTPQVDTISGATTTSKALLKAIENSINKPD